MTEYLLYAVIGKIIIHIAMHFPPLAESRFEFVRRLFNCSLCCGVWIFTILSWGVQSYLFADVFGYVPVLSEFITGSITSLLVFLVSTGFEARFMTIEVK